MDHAVADRRKSPATELPLAQGNMAGKTSLGTVGGLAPRSGGMIFSPSGPVALAEGRAPMPSTCPVRIRRSPS